MTDHSGTNVLVWRGDWIAQQFSRSQHPQLFWETVADCLVTARQQLHHDAVVPLGLTDFGQPQVMDFLLKRYLRASDLEFAGNPEALVLYEANVADLYSGLSPYDRLVNVYTHRQWYADALRVCDAYSEQPWPLGMGHHAYFQDHIQRLRKQL